MKTKSVKVYPNLASATSSARVVRVATMATSLFAGLLIMSPVSAASACKGLNNSACAASASCGWVESYQRKDGRTVKAFCRTKSSAAKKTHASKSSKPSVKNESRVAKNGA